MGKIGVAKDISIRLSLPGIKSLPIAVLLAPTLWISAATAGDRYALIDRSNNIVLQQEFDDHPPVPAED
jgi:hypothetical protein